MMLRKIRIREKEIMPFTIPSGIVTTQIPCLERMAREIPELGILTTKSIGPEQRLGNKEPILSQYAPSCFVNAVGLTNPGAEEFAEELSQANFPEHKFLLASIFGKNAEEFVYVAGTLEERVDGFEFNLSCPHCEKVGQALGQDPDMVGQIIKKVSMITHKPIFAKLTPNARNIGEIAQSAIKAGAYGIVAINTVGPGYYSVDGHTVLTNTLGGMSGRGILPLGLRSVKEIRKAVGEKVPIIGVGGITTANNIKAYSNAGANIFGIGSALAGMSEKDIVGYFATLVNDIKNDQNKAEVKKVDMEYQKMQVRGILNLACDFKVVETGTNIEAYPGQFVFAWIPGVGEKPFSIMNDNPLTLGVLEKGEFTRHFNQLQERESFYVRGPYGQGVDVPKNSDVFLIGGGCGIAGLYLLAKRFSKESNVTTLLAAKDRDHIPYLEKFEKYGKVGVATEDGSLGRKGLVTDLMENLNLRREGSYFFNCGPKAMINAILPLELEVSTPERIYSSMDYTTRCGVGICGSCADEKGRRTCVEGPFISNS